MTSAVPRSGCEAISTIAAPATSSSGRMTAAHRPQPRRASSRARPAACRTSASFMSSDGWNCSGPAPIQRCAPLISTPMPGILTATSSDERDRQQRRRQARQQLEAAAREELQHDEPDRAVGDVLDEVHRAVALALEQRPRRRRAVDHDRAGRQQAERRGEQDVVLDRLGLAPGLRRGLGTGAGRRQPSPSPFDAGAPDPSPRGRARADGVAGHAAPRGRMIDRRRDRTYADSAPGAADEDPPERSVTDSTSRRRSRDVHVWRSPGCARDSR